MSLAEKMDATLGSVKHLDCDELDINYGRVGEM